MLRDLFPTWPKKKVVEKRIKVMEGGRKGGGDFLVSFLKGKRNPPIPREARKRRLPTHTPLCVLSLRTTHISLFYKKKIVSS